MTTLTYPNSKLVFLDENGNTGTTILPESITTPSITLSSITDSNGSTGASGYVLSSTGNGIVWISPPINNNNSDLDMNNYSINNAGIINCTNVNVINVTSETTFANQISFSTPPICLTAPTMLNHLTTKEYTDNKLASSGVYNLYLNRTETVTVPLTIGSTGYSVLSNSISSKSTQTMITTSATFNKTVPIVSFISNILNTTQIPSSLFNLNIYGNNITGNHNVCYEFNVKLYRGGVIIPLGSSKSSIILNHASGYPRLYTMSVSIPTSQPTNLTDRIVIELYATNTSTTTTCTLHTYFEYTWYSYLQIQSNTMNPFKISKWVETATSDLTMNGYNITSTTAMTISSPNKTLSLGNNSSVINIEKNIDSNIYIGGITGSTIYLGQPLTLNYVNIGNSTTTLNALGKIRVISFTSTRFPNTSTTSETTSTSSIITIPGVWFFTIGMAINVITRDGTLYEHSLTIYKNSKITNNYICGRNLISPVSLSKFGQVSIITCRGIITTTTSTTIICAQKIKRSSTLSTLDPINIGSQTALIRIG
jgi:hypothetical protein